MPIESPRTHGCLHGNFRRGRARVREGRGGRGVSPDAASQRRNYARVAGQGRQGTDAAMPATIPAGR